MRIFINKITQHAVHSKGYQGTKECCFLRSKSVGIANLNMQLKQRPKTLSFGALEKLVAGGGTPISRLG
jgi:hypothetical protein